MKNNKDFKVEGTNKIDKKERFEVVYQRVRGHYKQAKRRRVYVRPHLRKVRRKRKKSYWW